jgi:hypothetical protein
MDTKELISQFFVEFIKLFVSGILGGAVVSIFSFRLFKAQKSLEEKYEQRRRQLDALRDIDLMLHWLYRDISYNWEKPLDENKTPEEYIVEVMNKIHYWQTLFLSDEETTKTLQQLENLVGMSKESFLGEKPSQKRLGQTITELKMAVRVKIVEIERK